jgi:hypothetical protein
MIIKIDRHAKKRMKWRQISEEEINLTLTVPDKIEESINGRMNAFKMIGNKYIKVTYKELKDEILVISVVNKT